MSEQWWKSKTHNNIEYEYVAKNHYESDHIDELSGQGYYSQLSQDMFVTQVLNYKKNGTFVDIGAAHPIKINNTYKLEDDLNWSGVSVDLGPNTCPGLPDSKFHTKFTSTDYEEFWNKYRKTPIIVGDALEVDYKELFEKYNLPKTIDYLSVDIEPPDDGTFEALKKALLTGYKFNVITFETERDRINPETNYFYNNIESRKFITSFGYELVNGPCPDVEDWYIHKSYIKENPDCNYFCRGWNEVSTLGFRARDVGGSPVEMEAK
jgi:hypothetical protein